jgi:hypothetical protein
MGQLHPHPDQLQLHLAREDEMERIIEARVAVRAEADAFRWRIRLILIETLMMGVLVAVAGFSLRQPTGQVIRSAIIVAGACFASGGVLILASGAAGWVVSRIRRWRQA